MGTNCGVELFRPFVHCEMLSSYLEPYCVRALEVRVPAELSFQHVVCRQAFGLAGGKGRSVAARCSPRNSCLRSSLPVHQPPSGPQWVREIKLDAYRMAARIDSGRVQLLTRTGLDWSAKYPSALAALASLNVKTAYIDGELCGVDDAEVCTDAGGDRRGARRAPHLLRFRSLAHGAWDVSGLSLVGRKALLEPLVSNKPGLQWPPRHRRRRTHPEARWQARGFEGVVSMTIDAPYAPGNRGLWRKAEALNCQEFVVVGFWVNSI